MPEMVVPERFAAVVAVDQCCRRRGCTAGSAAAGTCLLDCDEDVFSVAVQLIDAVPLLRMLTLKVCASVATREFAPG